MSLLAAGLIALNCTPALPFYCRNIHVGCAGRTRVQTEAFTVSDYQVLFDGGEIWQIRTTADRDARILWHNDHQDWIRLEADGRFSLRRYAPRAMMTRGMCRPKP